MAEIRPRLGRPRDPAKHDAAIGAVLSLLAEGGFYELRVDDVAARADLPKSTIYRRWPSINALVIDAYRVAFPPPELETSEDPLADLDALVEHVIAMLKDNPLGRTLPHAGARIVQDTEFGEEYREAFVEPYLKALRQIIERGIRGGQFAPGPPAAVVADMLFGYCMFEMVFRSNSPDAADLRSAAHALLHVATAAPAATR